MATSADHPDMTTAVYLDAKQHNNNNSNSELTNGYESKFRLFCYEYSDGGLQ